MSPKFVDFICPQLYRFYRLQVLTYKCGKCTNIVVSARRGMFGLCNEVLEIGVTLVTSSYVYVRLVL